MVARTIKGLSHVRRLIRGGGEVYVLDRGSIITSEDEAMLQALHSRSTGGFLEHLKKLEEAGSGRFMERYYVGYGHKSIADCGDTTIFIEGVSMLVAKAIQDYPLYSGQEASTRYVDFSRQKFIDPTNTAEGPKILEDQRNFYLALMEPVKAHLRNLHPRGQGEREKEYEGAIEARAFDIARGFLPAGASTNLAWHSNLRQIADRVLFLRHHPLEEVRNVAVAVLEAVREYHPHSFNPPKFKTEEEERAWKETQKAIEDYQDLVSGSYFYHNPDSPDLLIASDIDLRELERHRDLFNKRPPKAEVPKFLSQVGSVRSEFRLDFGSFRDVHRHRAFNQRMPLLTTDLGFNLWYLNSLPSTHRGMAQDHLGSLEERIRILGVSPAVGQYLLPMGFNTANKIKGDIPSMVYFVELRDSRFVHPTLQRVAKAIGDHIENEGGIPLNRDLEPNRFDVRRGDQTIIDLGGER